MYLLKWAPERCQFTRITMTLVATSHFGARILRSFELAPEPRTLFAATARDLSAPEKSFPNLIEWNRNQIVFTIFRLTWNQTDVRLVPNQSENGKYNLISVWFNKTSKRFICVYEAKKKCVRLGRLWKKKNLYQTFFLEK